MMAHLKNAMNLRENILAWKFLLSMEAVNRLYLLLKRNMKMQLIPSFMTITQPKGQETNL